MEKIALVTGAGTGIGRAVAAALVQSGFAVALAGRREDVLREAAAQIGGTTSVHRADVSDEHEVDALFAAVVDRFGRLDLLVNNAGTSAPQVPIDELDVQRWHDVVAVNLTGTFLCTRAAFRQMKRQDPGGGRIINNGSISSMAPRPNSAPYTATKTAVTGLTRQTALDGRPFGIACGQIDIGNVRTDLLAMPDAGVPQADGSLAVEPTMGLAEVAEAVRYMASLPPSANVLSMTVMATTMPFVGRG
ncbi:SDR family oxidoreductase [Kineococcus rhizosphaerae]|uniref:NADP-dependent 3-hydroxy acid dehydrogenase YdfG n=1 Tax=Kineococcus rhizosphaerae TaxID=559628 RepID=A0A2T0R6R6_9ACTN|nr:SDR family oxidoreductase [Kineococcus rhizosphaerae]PRY16866.1 NADP-dependent 3-hydroxy acid dehydrogenase YdfG [Kineococcus rhizosphaerae]